MKKTDISLEAVAKLASPPRYKHDDVIGQLQQNHSQWLASIKEQFDGDWEALIASIVASMNQDDRSLIDKILGRPRTTCTPLQSHKRISMAFALFYAGRGDGLDLIAAGLQSKNKSTREWALYHAQDIRGWISRPVGKATSLLQMERLFPALAFAFENINSESESFYVSSCVGLWFGHPEYLHLLAPLQNHREPRVFLSVIEQFSEMRRDEGTLDIVASHLLEPGVLESKNLVGGGIHVTRELCRYLSFWAKQENLQPQRLQATQIAIQVVLEALNSSNAVERLAEPGHGWFGIDDLFNILQLSKSGQAVDIFVRMSTDDRLGIFTRLNALVSHKIMTGIALEAGQVLIHDLLALDSGFDHHRMHLCINELAKLGLISLNKLLPNAGKPNWTWVVTEAVSQRSHGDASDALIVKVLSGALARFGSDYPQYKEEIAYLGNSLKSLPRTMADEAYIRQSINAALASAQRMEDKPWLVQEAEQLLMDFGGGDEFDLENINPWNAMREHWRREAISTESATQLLIDAGAMDSITQVEQPQHVHLAQKIVDARSQAEGLLLAGGRATLQSLSNIGYEHHHDRLFAVLTGLVRPPVILEAVAQQGEMRFDALAQSELPSEVRQLGLPVFTTEGTLVKILVHFQNQCYEFYASPNGTYMDVWAVLHAFNKFMGKINRSERVFWLGTDDDGHDYAYLVCASPDKFIAASEKLRLPIRQPL